MSETKPEEQSDSQQGGELEQQESPPESGGEQQESLPDHEQLALLLEDARARADEHWDQVLRLQAELENLRKRQQRELESAHKYALERCVQELLPVKDSLEMGLAAAREVEEESSARLCEGTELTLKMLQTALEKFGVREIDPAGQPFDPELHQAMSAVASEGSEPNTVLNVMQKGYLLNDRLIRPAMVVVAK